MQSVLCCVTSSWLCLNTAYFRITTYLTPSVFSEAKVYLLLVDLLICKLFHFITSMTNFDFQGLEIYGNESKSTSHLYLSLKSKTARDDLYKAITEQPELRLSESKQDIMTLQWQNGTISNYDYLLYINR